MKFVKNTLIFGLFLAAPAGITLWIILGVISFFDQTFAPMVPFHFPGMGLLFAVLSLFMVGLIGSTFLGKLLKNSFDSLLEHVPLVRNIYKLFTQIADDILVEILGGELLVWDVFNAQQSKPPSTL